MNADLVRRSTIAAQALLQSVEPSLVIDGKPGTYTGNVYNKAPDELKLSVDRVVSMVGVQGGMRALLSDYASFKKLPSSASSEDIFSRQIVPAIIVEAKKRGLNAANLIGQLGAESSWGRQPIPAYATGKPSYNYGGIKYDTAKRYVSGGLRSIAAMTREAGLGRVRQQFAGFDSADAFVSTYLDYLTNSPRYGIALKASSADEFAAALKKGGYATDENYKSLIVGAVAVAKRKYQLA